MNEQEAIAYLDSFYPRKSERSLSRIRELMAALGNPQDGLRFIHVAGTNGKGSTCAMLENILRQAGYRTGLFTSPHLRSYRERIRVGGQCIPPEELGELTEWVRPFAEALPQCPHTFELITAVALCWFARQGCDLVVLEVGLGGEFDATNVISVPECAVITSIGLDHTAILGETLGEIARAKAGIIKVGGDVVACSGPPEAERVIRETCRSRGARLFWAGEGDVRFRRESLDGQRFDAGEYRDLGLALLGRHQRVNAALALKTLWVLRDRGWSIPEQAIRAGLEGVRWPARLELLNRDPPFFLDGGHNPPGVESVTESLETLLPGRRLVFLTGMLRDKDVEVMARKLCRKGEMVFTVAPRSPRALPAGELAEVFSRLGAGARPCGSVREGVRLALEAAGRDGAVCCIGSLYLAGEVRECFFPDAGLP